VEEIRVLLVDDEPGIRDMIKEYMAGGGYEPDEAGNGLRALEMLEVKKYDIVVLDIMMPGMDGWSVAKGIRKTSDIPIIMLSARGEEYDKLLGFDMGIDDYMVKPFSPKELLARIRALTARRRREVISSGRRLEFGSLVIDLDGRKVMNSSEALQLTPKEFELLSFLAENPGKAFTRDHILSAVWGYDFEGDDRTVDTHIKQLRERLGESRKMIVTVWGTGYKFDPEVGP
jgi:DNA-binding response OmpR family regulator